TSSLVADVSRSAGGGRRSFAALVQVVCNVLENPSEPKFQELWKTNLAIVDVAPCAMLLRRLGFQDLRDRFQLQRSGLRGSEVARLQMALSEYPACRDLVERLAPAIMAVGLEWRKPDGSVSFLPPAHMEGERLADAPPQFLPCPFASAEDADSDLQEALRLSLLQT
ncbi:unnamed protein product, partial [Polarella glacialis]